MVAVVGDSLAVGMRPYLAARPFVARKGMTTAEGLRVLRRLDVRGRTVFVSLGTNDLDSGRRQFATQVRAVERLVGDGCVVWSLVRVDWSRMDDPLDRVLRGAEGPRMRVVRAVSPGRDGVHLSAAGYRLRARRYRRAARGCVTPTTRG